MRIVRQCGKIGVPVAALNIDECDFSQLTASDWSQVLVLRPDLVGKFESIDRCDWRKDDEIDDVEDIPPRFPVKCRASCVQRSP